MGFCHTIKESGEKKGLRKPLHVLNSSGQETLLTHVLNTEHASKAQAMIFLGLRKRMFNGLFAPCVNAFIRA